MSWTHHSPGEVKPERQPHDDLKQALAAVPAGEFILVVNETADFEDSIYICAKLLMVPETGRTCHYLAYRRTATLTRTQGTFSYVLRMSCTPGVESDCQHLRDPWYNEPGPMQKRRLLKRVDNPVGATFEVFRLAQPVEASGGWSYIL